MPKRRLSPDLFQRAKQPRNSPSPPSHGKQAGCKKWVYRICDARSFRTQRPGPCCLCGSTPCVRTSNRSGILLWSRPAPAGREWLSIRRTARQVPITCPSNPSHSISMPFRQLYFLRGPIILSAQSPSIFRPIAPGIREPVSDVGSSSSGAIGGTGIVFIDDIGFGPPAATE